MNNAKILMSGPKVEIWCYTRNGQTPVSAFLKSIPDKLQARFHRQWERLTREGLPAVVDHQSLAPLAHPGKGLWAFKEFDARIYATIVPNGADGRRRFALLDGWTKDKSSSLEEDRQILRVQRLRGACLALPWSLMTAAPVVSEVAAAPTAPSAPTPPEPMPEAAPLEHENVEDPAAPPSTDRVLTLTDLATLCDVPYSTLRGWIRQGKLPAPSIPAAKQGTFGWIWSDADALYAASTGLRKSCRRGRPPSKPRCPEESSTPVVGPSQPSDPILSRDALVNLAARVIDGDDVGDTFLGHVRRRLDRIAELETVRRELSRLLGKDVS